MQSFHHKISILQFSKFSEKTPNICEYISLANHNIKFQQSPWTRKSNNAKIILFLFDTSTSKMQSFNHKISILYFSNFSGKLQINVTQAALHTMVSNFSLDRKQCRNYFCSYLTYLQYFHHIFLFIIFSLAQKNSKCKSFWHTFIS